MNISIWHRILAVAAIIVLAGSTGDRAQAQSTQIRLDYAMTLFAPLEPPKSISPGLAIVNIKDGGTVTGPGISGRIIAPAGDWLRPMADGSARGDVRATLVTDDNALIYLEYNSVIKPTKEGAEKSRAGQELGTDDAYFMMTLRFHTAAEKYTWLNHVQAIGKMVSLKRGDHVKYDIFIAR